MSQRAMAKANWGRILAASGVAAVFGVIPYLLGLSDSIRGRFTLWDGLTVLALYLGAALAGTILHSRRIVPALVVGTCAHVAFYATTGFDPFDTAGPSVPVGFPIGIFVSTAFVWAGSWLASLRHRASKSGT